MFSLVPRDRAPRRKRREGDAKQFKLTQKMSVLNYKRQDFLNLASLSSIPHPLILGRDGGTKHGLEKNK